MKELDQAQIEKDVYKNKARQLVNIFFYNIILQNIHTSNFRKRKITSDHKVLKFMSLVQVNQSNIIQNVRYVCV